MRATHTPFNLRFTYSFAYRYALHPLHPRQPNTPNQKAKRDDTNYHTFIINIMFTTETHLCICVCVCVCLAYWFIFRRPFSCVHSRPTARRSVLQSIRNSRTNVMSIILSVRCLDCLSEKQFSMNYTCCVNTERMVLISTFLHQSDSLCFYPYVHSHTDIFVEL